ncbi:SusC/RagA family TonB-linked outer membrane protein [Foetidibacter luteolus]|uniref:SusC/RagA family TonB-linked outer membrane protein n=1 Tax=Foetidibacter luteolus TaxID=2608880 RepID=UPI00129BE109|nr:TonB-dependent receptor [Foetidibacter luteolus]
MYLNLSLNQKIPSASGYLKIFAPALKNFLLLLFTIILPVFIFAQTTVTGKITDENAAPLAGVSIRVAGTQTGTTTDANGAFTIKANKGQVLEISYVGKTEERITVGDNTSLTITLKDLTTSGLDQVVVVGYGTQAKKDLTGSVGVVSQSKMSNQATVGIGQNLQGKLAGVQVTQNDGTPYGGTSIRIRGAGSFGASSDPLVVIDGIITNDGLSNLNPNDVENITVLKDAASSAIYGSRGANGVVIVTTKRGNFESPMKVDLSSFASVDKIRYMIPTLTAKEYAVQVNDYYGGANLPKPFTQAEIDAYGEGTNWVKEISQAGLKQNHSLSISGGTKNNIYALSANYYAGDGVIKNTAFKRGNVRLSNDNRISNSLKVGVNLNVNYGVSRNSDWGQAIDRALIFPSTQPVYDANGEYSAATHNGEPVTMLNPLIPVNLWTYKQNWKKLLGTTYLEWSILKDLKFKTSFNAEYYSWNQDQFIPSYRHGPAGLIGDHPIAELYVTGNENINYSFDNILTYTKQFNSHSITAMAGYTFQETNGSNIGASRNSFLNNDPNMQVLDAGNSNISNNGSKYSWAIQSYLGRINYGFKDKYLLSASLRVDQTSRISKNNRTGVFPGASAGWVVSKENFFEDVTFISNLKLRASWGILGNQAIGEYPYQTTLNSTGLYYPFGSGGEGVTYTGVGPTSLGNPNILWEKTTTYGAGLEIAFLQNKLNLIADFYKRNTSDILVQVPLLSTSGVTNAPYQNAGRVSNTGIELTLGYSDAIGKAFKYDVSVNWTYNKNRVTGVPSPIINNFSRIQEGYSINEWFGYIQEGIFQTTDEISKAPTQPNASPGDIRFKDLDNNGVIDANDRTFLGPSVAQNSFGGSISLGYKGFDLVTAFYGQLGALRSIDQVGFAITRGGEQTSAWMYRQRWTGPGTSNYVPRVVAGDPNDNYRRSTFWLRSSDFFRLQNLQIGYDFVGLLSGSTAKVIHKLRFYVAAQNLFCINSYPGWDPEQSINGGYPIPRSYYAGVNLQF